MSIASDDHVTMTIDPWCRGPFQTLDLDRDRLEIQIPGESCRELKPGCSDLLLLLLLPPGGELIPSIRSSSSSI